MLYLCICVFVFVYLCMRHLVISVLIFLEQELSENVWFVWSKTSQSGKVEVMTHTAGRPVHFHLETRPIRRMGRVKKMFDPTGCQNFGDAPGQTPKLILTLCHKLNLIDIFKDYLIDINIFKKC